MSCHTTQLNIIFLKPVCSALQQSHNIELHKKNNDPNMSCTTVFYKKKKTAVKTKQNNQFYLKWLIAKPQFPLSVLQWTLYEMGRGQMDRVILGGMKEP